ncbi:MAG: histidinol-phosphate transaminase [bacterium]
MSDAVNELIQHWIPADIRALQAYHVADAEGLVKLDAMENPYVWPEALREEWAALIAQTDVNRYPDPVATEVTTSLREALGLSDDMALMLGNGSDEIIQILAMALAGPGRTLMSVEPSFVMYKMIAKFCQMKYVGVPLAADYHLDLAATLQAIDEHQPAVIFLAYPNNPTGNLFEVADIEAIIRATPGIVVIDEAYAPFTDHSFLSRLGEFPNLLVMRTLSKMGLAGLRLGMLAGPTQWLSEFDKLRLPYNINVLTQVTAAFALRHQSVFDDQTTRIREARADLMSVLAKIEGIELTASEANFVLIRVPEGKAVEIHAGMRDRGVLIKCLHGSHPLLVDCLRLTVGTPEQNVQMIDALKASL